MKKIILVTALVVSCLAASAQFTYKIKADSLLVTNDSCTAELNLENGTRNVKGFLYNKGNGRTEFRQAMINQGDSIFLIGGDTLKRPTLQNVTTWGNTTTNKVLIGKTVDSGSHYLQVAGKAWVDRLYLRGVNDSAVLDIKLAGTAAPAKPIVAVTSNAGLPLFEIRSYYNATDARRSIYIGDSSGASGVFTSGLDGAQNTALGSKALKSVTTGFFNTAIGAGALQKLVSGNFNCAFGQGSLISLTTGVDNLAIGQASLLSSTSGNFNVGIGSNALQDNITGIENIAIGKSAGFTNTGSGNVFIGRTAGGQNKGSFNVFIGYNAGSINNAVSNRLFIANSATANPLIYGEFDNSFFKINGKAQTSDTLTITTMGNADSSDRASTTAWVKRQGYVKSANTYARTVLTSDVTNNNATANTIQDVTGLSFPVTAGVTYKFKFFIIYTAAATTTGSRWTINGPATTFLHYQSQYSLASASVTNNQGSAAYDLPAECNAASAATNSNIAIIEGVIKPSSSGTVIARFASEVSSSAIVAKGGMCYVEFEAIN